MRGSTARDPWIQRARRAQPASMRLFCLPYAGGGASIYKDWGRFLPDFVEVCAVQLPGREERISEPAHQRIESLLPVLLERLAPYLDRPFALFGHSMGAIVAYETARALERRGDKPLHLMVSGQRAPHLPLSRPTSYALPDESFRMRLRELNGTPEPALQDAELMAMVMPLLRSDFELSETYQRAPVEPVACPITAFGGHEDGEVDRRSLEAWREASAGETRVRLFPGDHFFLHSQTEPLLAAIGDSLARHGL